MAILEAMSYDATIEYFGRDHLPYAILAIVITLLFDILPLLFALLATSPQVLPRVYNQVASPSNLLGLLSRILQRWH